MKYSIFDMDGLLIDSEPVWRQVQQDVLLQCFGLEIELSKLAQYTGISTNEFAVTMARLYPQAEIDTVVCRNTIIDTMLSRIHLSPLMPGAREILDWSSDQGVNIAIASSSPRPLIESVIKQHGLPVSTFVSGMEVERSKPHPAVFELAAKRLGAAPWQCKVWEDSVNGVIAGKAAGTVVIAVPDQAHQHPEKFSIADYTYKTLTESLSAERRIKRENITGFAYR